MFMKINASVKREYVDNGKIVLHFQNFITGEKFSKIYNTNKGAKTAETKFFNSVYSSIWAIFIAQIFLLI